MIYDLESRTSDFSQRIIFFVKTLTITKINQNIISQLLRSATSIGANYREANNGSSKKDFINKISICRKEARETEYWIELLAKIETDRLTELRVVWSEAHQLTLIFGKISSSSKLKI
jgi:four helix bundle protein